MPVCRIWTSGRRRQNWEGEISTKGWPGGERNCSSR